MAVGLPLLLAIPAVQADPIDWPTLGFSQVGTSTFNNPIIITHAGDGSGRLFIGEQQGRLKIIQGTNELATSFLDIAYEVSFEGPEQGLLGLAFPPGFSTYQYFYVDYTSPAGSVVISRFHVSSTNANVADVSSEQVLKVIAKPYGNHNGGQIAFGPDGYLYIGVGDGGSEGDPQNYGQTTEYAFREGAADRCGKRGFALCHTNQQSFYREYELCARNLGSGLAQSVAVFVRPPDG